MKRNLSSLILIVLILLLATFLRFHLLDGQSFWNDEGNSARLSERSISLIIEGTASDIHPPLYYLGLRGWRELVGESEFGLRSFSAFAGVLVVAVSYALAKRWNTEFRREGPEEHGEKREESLSVPTVTAVIITINPALIYYSQEARMYALLGLWAVLTSWLMLVWWEKRSISVAFGYILFATAGLYTHYFFPVVLVVHNLFVVICLPFDKLRTSLSILRQAQDRFVIRTLLKRVFQWAGMMVAVFLLYLPWLPIFLQKFGSDGVKRPLLPDFLHAVWRWMLFGATVENVIPALIILALLGLWGVIKMRKQAILPLLGMFIPLVFMYFTGTTGPEFFKFLVVSVPFVAILLTMGKGKWGGWIGLLTLLILLPGTVRSLNNMYHNPAYARADYRGMAAQIEAEAHPNAGVILDAPNQWEVFTYYYADESVYPLPKGRSHPSPAEIDATLTDIAAKHDRLYAIFWGEAQRDPQRLIESWLDEHTFKATDEWVGDVRFVTYAVSDEAATEMETAVSLPFGESIQLNGYTLRADALQGGDIVQVTLFWQTAVSLSQRYKVFLHLVDQNGQPIAQRDSEPRGGLSLTTSWQPNELIIDNHGVLLPAGLPVGKYNLLLGLYDVADPSKRLLIQAESGEVDAWLLAEILVGQ